MRCQKFLRSFFFWWQNGSPLRNPGKIIISRRFHKLYKLPKNSINRDSKHLKFIRTNGLNVTDITTKY